MSKNQVPAGPSDVPFEHLVAQFSHAMSELAVVLRSTELPNLRLSGRQRNCILGLFGTTVLEALYIIDGLQAGLSVDGDVCEFGVAQGRTSALLAATLLDHNSDKRLWLYDSFEGLPAPSSKDVLIHDILNLGSMEAYKGWLSIPEVEVLGQLAKQGFSMDRVEICKGWIEQSLAAGRMPDKVSFAFLDMDFYQSTHDVLTMLVDRMPSGGRMVVDDYNFFSSGVETAVREITERFPGVFQVQNPHGSKFALLRRN